MIPNSDADQTLALQRAIDAQYSVGYLKTKLDVSKMADLSMVKEAAARVNAK